MRTIASAATALVLILMLAACGASHPNPTVKSRVHGCEDAFFPALTVAVVCGGGRLGPGFGFASAAKSAQAVPPDRLSAKLFTKRPLAPGDRIVLRGRAAAGARLSVVLVNPRGRSRIVDFDQLGLEHGARSTVIVTGTRNRPRCVLRTADGRTIRPARDRLRKDYRYVTGLRVRRSGPALQVSFLAPAALADVYELKEEAVEEEEGLYGEGEVEGEAILAHRTVRTRAGTIARLRLPARPGAEFIFVQPLARRFVQIPALAAVPD